MDTSLISSSRLISALEKCRRPSSLIGGPFSNPDGIKTDAHGLHEREALGGLLFCMDSNSRQSLDNRSLWPRVTPRRHARNQSVSGRAAWGGPECEVIAINSDTGEGLSYKRRRLLADKTAATSLTDVQLRALAMMALRSRIPVSQGKWQTPGLDSLLDGL